MQMQIQTPAKGILLSHDYGDAKFYSLECNCGSDNHTVKFHVEANEFDIEVNTYTKQFTSRPYIDEEDCLFNYDNCEWLHNTEYSIRMFIKELLNRLSLTKKIWFDGYIEFEQEFLMDEQQATNYAYTLLQAINDVKEFKKDTNGRNKSRYPKN